MAKKKVEKIDAVQHELDVLQRRFRDMEAKHRLFGDDSVQTIRMQRQKIDKLKHDNERLKEELALETRQANASTGIVGTTHITNFKDQSEMYQRKIEIERRRIAELDAQIKKMEESILQQRSDMGGFNANRDSRTIQKNIRMLENRLDKALVKYNEALGHNKKLRETIDNLRRERVVFDGIYRKLEGDLEKCKNEMASIIEEANQAYLHRDLAQAEMLRLRDAADKEQKQFEHEWRELTKLIDQDEKMKDFLNNKDREKMNDAVVTSVLEQEQQLRKRLSKGAWAIVKDKAHIHMAQEKVKSYEEAFDKIQQATKISDIDELVNTFIDAEETNFKLFNKVNSLSNEIERLEESIQNIQSEIERLRGNKSSTSDQSDIVNNDDNKDLPVAANGTDMINLNAGNSRKKKILGELEQKIACADDKTAYYKKKHSESLQVITSLKDGISNILNQVFDPSFKLTNIDATNINSTNNENIGGSNIMNDEETRQAMLEMIENTGVTETNVTQVLGEIEQKTNNIIEEYLNLSGVGNNDMRINISAVENDSVQEIAAVSSNQVAVGKGLDDKEAEAAALGVGIGAASLQPLVATPATVLDDFSDASDDEDDDFAN